MKRLMVSVLAAAGATCALGQVGVSVSVNQPGVYGRIDIGEAPMPALVYPQPIVIAPQPVYAERRPIYLYVSQAEQRDWRRYCRKYAACGQQVYFVQEQWVRERYEQQHPGWDRGRHRGWDRHGKHDDKHGGRHGEKNGRGHGD